MSDGVWILEVVTNFVAWHIGNGRKTRLVDPWVDGVKPSIHQRGYDVSNMNVSRVILQEGGWDKETLSLLFSRNLIE